MNVFAEHAFMDDGVIGIPRYEKRLDPWVL